MSGIVKALTGILGVLAVVACLATVGIIGYTLTDTGRDRTKSTAEKQPLQETEVLVVPSEVPVSMAESDKILTPTPYPAVGSDHVHDYKEKVIKKATCYSAGQIEYQCECGDSYYVDTLSTNHVAGEWEIAEKPTAEKAGVKIKKCIYCDEILEQEKVPYGISGSSTTGTEEEKSEAHVHQYTASVEREPTCVLAGLRKYTCSCGNFYTEIIHASGHVASDWEVAEAATTTQMGTEQRTCKVCGVLLDSRPINRLTASPATSSSTSGGTASATPAAAASSSPAASSSAAPASSASAAPGTSANASSSGAHVHKYVSYVLKEANCTEKGIRSFVCEGCGSSYGESIELDMNNHTFRSVVIPATRNTMGYTIYTCIRCNYSYNDNYTPALGTS